jgi:hypothetical protein
MIHIDWLSIYQDFPGQDYPRLAKEVRTRICALTGELILETTTGYQHDGSYDTSLLIKFDGIRLSMSGNPSGYNRLDNLFGCSTVRTAVDIYNKVLESIGYPQFYDCENTNITAMPFQSSEKYFKPGLKITRVDLTENYACDTSTAEMLRYLSTFSYRGQCGYLYPNGRTVDWMGDRSGETGASKRLYFKYYDKAYDVELKIKKIKRDLQHLSAFDDDFNNRYAEYEQRLNYLSRLQEYLIFNNVIRFELELKSKTLEENNLQNLVGWSDNNMILMFDKYKLHESQTINFNAKIDLYSQLVDLGIKPSRARSSAAFGQMWLDGHDIDYKRCNLLSKATYYRIRSDLLKIGFDIKNQINIVNFPTQINTVMLKPLSKPDFYIDIDYAA